MSVRFDASGDRLTRTATLPTMTSFSLLAWALVSVSAGFTGALAHGLNADGSQNFYSVGLGNSGGLKLNTYPGDASVGYYGTTVLATATWYHIALTCAGTGTNQFLAYLNGVAEITRTATAVSTAGRLMVGDDQGGDPFNGRVAAVKIYSAVLTADEIKQEMRSYMPVRTANLNTWSPLLVSTDVGNYANTGAWTVGGTLTTEDGPPIAWSLRPASRWRRATAAAPTGAPQQNIITRQVAVARAALY